MARRGSQRDVLCNRAPPPASGSGSEEVVDAGVYRVVWGPVFLGGLGGNPPPSWGPGYHLR